MDLSKLKKRTRDISKLVAATNEQNNNGSNKDERFWKPKRDDAGNGMAIIRFLPSPDTDLDWTRYWDHGFKGKTGKWYIEKSLTSIGQDDPAGVVNKEAWDAGDKETARARKRRLHYICNIEVLHDPAQPETEGNVYLYEFGVKIFDKIKEALDPEFEDEEAINPFDLWEGADFAIKIRSQKMNINGKTVLMPNYDKSEFRSKSAHHDGDEERLQSVADRLHKLSEFTDPENYKSYEELERRLNDVLGITSSAPRNSGPVEESPMENVRSEEPTPEPEEETPPFEPDPEEDEEDDEDDALSYFQKLANGDD